MQIAAEGRKYGLWLLLSTQRPSKVHINALSQCDNLALMRMSSPKDLAELAIKRRAYLGKTDNVTVIVSLHQVDYAKDYCKRTIAMRDGEVVFDGPSSELTPQFLQELYGEHSSELFADGAAQAAEPAVKPIAEKDLAVATS